MANAEGRTATMNGGGESDGSIVPRKTANNGAQPPSGGHPLAEPLEGRDPTKGNATQPTANGTQCPIPASRGLGGIREAARRDPRERFTALLHHVTESLLLESYESLSSRPWPKSTTSNTPKTNSSTSPKKSKPSLTTKPHTPTGTNATTSRPNSKSTSSSCSPKTTTRR
jgi:hypothetical protein